VTADTTSKTASLSGRSWVPPIYNVSRTIIREPPKQLEAVFGDPASAGSRDHELIFAPPSNPTRDSQLAAGRRAGS
jgi:hypothetical protein